MRIPWADAPSTESGMPTKHNIHNRLVRPLVCRSSAVPAALIEGPPGNITGPADSATESGESFAHGITDPNAAVALSLHALGLGGREQGIGNVLIVSEHGEVVTSHPQSLAQEDR